MKIKPLKDYKRPLYAIGVGTAIMAVALTGCTDPAKDKQDNNTATEYAKEESADATDETLKVITETITAGIVYIHSN